MIKKILKVPFKGVKLTMLVSILFLTASSLATLGIAIPGLGVTLPFTVPSWVTTFFGFWLLIVSFILSTILVGYLARIIKSSAAGRYQMPPVDRVGVMLTRGIYITLVVVLLSIPYQFFLSVGWVFFSLLLALAAIGIVPAVLTRLVMTEKFWYSFDIRKSVCSKRYWRAFAISIPTVVVYSVIASVVNLGVMVVPAGIATYILYVPYALVFCFCLTAALATVAAVFGQALDGTV
jgi:hypothetical protein